ncbi:MAG: hypothetical protein HY535_09155 [Chloroflexi bacterium]|nr:hypothetical protein [Chloroflexota bacterium]
MATKEQEKRALEQALEQREAGVTDLFEFYASVEAVYAASVKAMEEGQTAMASNSTNRG